ncbi:helix-turn-helix domain-containing protein [Pedobacter sp.]|uniref:helix-turn-helix domain-containing protein n=1 Tax=Pedobacter sp. TaxID=1411316 RepID=UPI003D7F716B
MANQKPYHIKTISEFHRFNGLPKPEHPLISIVDYGNIHRESDEETTSLMFGYYSISLKRGVTKMHYGQQHYDFDEGILYFMAPNQILKVHNNPSEALQRSGWLLLIDSDFLWNTPLASKIQQYEFFDYAVNEALFLSDKEEEILNTIVQNIQQEYHSNIDKFTQNVIISQLELLLTYAEWFYERQFITRKIANHKMLERLERLLNDYFNSNNVIVKGLPTVQHIANGLNVSPNYLSGLLKVLTGQSTQQHIHNKLIEKAKEKLSTTDLSVSEIAYELGFEHPQSFSKLFKTKTNLAPLEFRHSFS